MIEINGAQYKVREAATKQPIRRGLSPKIFGLIALFGGFGIHGRKQPEIPEVHIPTEYGLIQNKKSNLSKSQRDWVVFQFEKNFEQISEPS